MPPRLAHSKSRGGCQRCKVRKVKCSETKPACASCSRHGVSCVYVPTTPSDTIHPPTTRNRSSSASPSPRHSSPRHLSPPSAATFTSHSYATSTTLPSHPSTRSSTPFLSPALHASVPPLFNDSTPESPARRLLELRLLSHFHAVVMLTFASNDDPAVLTSWRHRLPALALRFPYLLNAVLATAALHLAVGGHGVGMTRDAGVGAGPSERGEKGNGGAGMEQEGEGERAAEEKNILGGLSRETYAGVHQTYFDLVLSQHRAAIDVLCADNADAVCMTSVFISNHGFLLGARQGYTSTAEMGALSREGARRAGQGIEGYEIPLHWLQLSAGIREVIRCVNDGLLAEDAIVRVLMSSFEWGAVDRMIRSEEAGVVFERLEDFERSPEPEGLEPRSGVFVELEEEEVSVEEVYRRALRYLGHVYLSIQGGETKARIARLCMSFTSMIPRAFVTLVEQRRPRAFVVLARLFAMTMPIGDVWWFRGVAERHVRGIGGIVPRDWQWAMEWPRQVIRGEIWTPALINMLR